MTARPFFKPFDAQQDEKLSGTFWKYCCSHTNCQFMFPMSMLTSNQPAACLDARQRMFIYIRVSLQFCPDFYSTRKIVKKD